MRLAALVLFCSTALAAPGVIPGEAYTFRFTVGPIEGARARMSVGLPATKDGRTLVAVQGEAETLSIAKLFAPISASYVLTLDTATLLPKDVTSIERGLHDVSYTHHYVGKELQLDVLSKAREQHWKRALSRETRDPISAYFALRALELRTGQTIVLDVLDGAVLWRARLRVVGPEDLQLSDDAEHPRAPARAIHLDGKLERIDSAGNSLGRPQRTIAVWLSDDDKRVLYRCSFDSELGRAKLDLNELHFPTALDLATYEHHCCESTAAGDHIRVVGEGWHPQPTMQQFLKYETGALRWTTSTAHFAENVGERSGS